MVGNQAKKNRVDRERKLHRVREKVFTKNEKVIVIKLKLLTSVKTVRLSIPYRTGWYGRNIPYRLAIRYTRPPCFIPEKIPAIPASYWLYRTISGNTGRYRAYRPVQKKVFFFFFLIFVIFEFLLGQNGNLFPLTY